MQSLILDGQFYPTFTADGLHYSDADKQCMQRTVEHLLAIQTSAERPGMLLGKIQSGKTKTFLGAIALAFDNGFDIAVILTKGTKALARQTLERVRREFAQSEFVKRKNPTADAKSRLSRRARRKWNASHRRKRQQGQI
jgi:RecG-like helicase